MSDHLFPSSALGKLSLHPQTRRAVPALGILVRDSHAQVRQYAASALGKIGDEAALPPLRDAANRADAPEYVTKSALRAIEQIQAAAALREEANPVACSRWYCPTTPEQRELSRRQFQRVYCSACFDAVFIIHRTSQLRHEGAEPQAHSRL